MQHIWRVALAGTAFAALTGVAAGGPAKVVPAGEPRLLVLVNGPGMGSPSPGGGVRGGPGGFSPGGAAAVGGLLGVIGGVTQPSYSQPQYGQPPQSDPSQYQPAPAPAAAPPSYAQPQQYYPPTQQYQPPQSDPSQYQPLPAPTNAVPASPAPAPVADTPIPNPVTIAPLVGDTPIPDPAPAAPVPAAALAPVATITAGLPLLEETADNAPDVTVIGPDGVKRLAQLGQVLRRGDIIETGVDQQIDLRFADGSVMHVEEMTQLYVADLENKGSRQAITVQLKLGEISATINPKKPFQTDFKVSTPQATIGVRGTKFSVGYDPRTQVATTAVTEHVVEVTPKNKALHSVVLHAGEQVEVGTDHISPIAPIAPPAADAAPTAGSPVSAALLDAISAAIVAPPTAARSEKSVLKDLDNLLR